MVFDGATATHIDRNTQLEPSLPPASSQLPKLQHLTSHMTAHTLVRRPLFYRQCSLTCTYHFVRLCKARSSITTLSVIRPQAHCKIHQVSDQGQLPPSPPTFPA